MDLHAWITQQVDAVEAAAHAATPGPWEGVVDHHQRGEVDASVWSNKLGYYITEKISSGDRHEADAQHIAANNPVTVLRRCEADRRLLNRHKAWPGSDWCDGCGPDLDTWLNDCPELLGLAHAHGITDEILAGLDRPQPPELPPRSERRLGLGGILATPPITTSDVPAALRGPRWKP
ncbi:DUF6221 family protein [Streptomyces tendae]|uniref:DUF6221 family protein n=1 Tax=Streptomyces tendae TaxID=1932 RepID=UPI003722B615